MKLVIPILLIPGGQAPPEDVEAVTKARLLIQDWWETRYKVGLLVYVTRPLSPPCAEDWDYFKPSDVHQDPRPWTQVNAWLAQQPTYNVLSLANLYGVRPQDVILLVFLKDFSNPLENHPTEYQTYWGWGGAGLALVDYDMVDEIAKASLAGGEGEQDANAGLGVVCHELGHCLSYPHSEPDAEHPNIMYEWWTWPFCRIPQAVP